MRQDKCESIHSYLKKRIRDVQLAPHVYAYGTVTSVSDSVAQVNGLPGRRYGELLEFENGIFGIALDLAFDGVGAVLFSSEDGVGAGSQVKGTGHVVEVPQGNALLGRVVDPIGRPLDGEPLLCSSFRPIESPAPGLIARQKVNEPLMTGLMSIDSMIPIGKGQRELIIGDRQTGKTTIAIDAILNQKGKDVICIYCAIAQKSSTIVQVIETLQKGGAMDYSVVVASGASDSAALQYIAPYAACAMAEGFMYDGKDVLIVYDDLSKHAVAYRTMSLLLHRPPGREAYPGDVFYLHSRLLERSARLSDALGGGSMTALPIVETMGDDISAYIPTNIISITDGQIFLESELFHSGFRPAVNVGLSVSRVGRAAQHPAMKKVSASLRIDLAQYRELAVFAQFGADIDVSTRKTLDRGARLTEMLKQNKNSPMSLSEQVVTLLAFQQNLCADIPAEQIESFFAGLLDAVRTQCAATLNQIEASRDLTDAARNVLLQSMNQYVQDIGGGEGV